MKTKTYGGGLSGNQPSTRRVSKEDSFDPDADPELTSMVEWIKETQQQLEEQVCLSSRVMCVVIVCFWFAICFYLFFFFRLHIAF